MKDQISYMSQSASVSNGNTAKFHYQARHRKNLALLCPPRFKLYPYILFNKPGGPMRLRQGRTANPDWQTALKRPKA
jgi:hypothetical protein